MLSRVADRHKNGVMPMCSNRRAGDEGGAWGERFEVCGVTQTERRPRGASRAALAPTFVSGQLFLGDLRAGALVHGKAVAHACNRRYWPETTAVAHAATGDTGPKQRRSRTLQRAILARNKRLSRTLQQAILARNKRRSEQSSRCAARAALDLRPNIKPKGMHPRQKSIFRLILAALHRAFSRG